MLSAALVFGFCVQFILFPRPALGAEASAASVPGQAVRTRAAASPNADRRSVLILSGVQFGLPVSDAVVSGSVIALKGKGVSVNDIHVE